MKRLLTYPAAVWILLISVADSSAEPVQWRVNGHYYEAVLVPGGISWDEADAAATAAGRYLAAVTSEEENEFVFGLVDSPEFWIPTTGRPSDLGPWLGGFQYPPTPVSRDNWQWVTGEPWSYTNWSPGNPDDFGGSDQDKLHFLAPEPLGGRSSYWNDMEGVDTGFGVPIAYVTEWVPEPSTLVLLGVGAACLSVCTWRRRTAPSQ